MEPNQQEPILEIKNLNSFYRQGGGAFSKGRIIQVLRNVNVTIGRGGAKFWAWWGSPAAVSPPWPSPSWA